MKLHPIIVAAILAVYAALPAAAILPLPEPVRESVDLIELNHFYDESGRLVFDQVIFYDWSSSDSRYQVRAWRLVNSHSQRPIRDWANGGGAIYIAAWQDGDIFRRVESPSFRETWTQFDPELVEREQLPKEFRRELRTIKIECKPRN